MIEEYLDQDTQVSLVSLARDICLKAPLYRAEMPKTGKPFTYLQSGAGWGWTSGHGGGYRYQRTHPVTGQELPSIPDQLLAIARKHGLQADSLLINWYTPGSSLGLHRDKDEKNLTHPIVSISLGDHAIFQLGGQTRNARVTDMELISGSVLVMSGGNRSRFHGIKTILPNSCIYPKLLKQHGRINLTLRKSQ
jgi:alkylated DNA repair protein (DNA oxidative demethylase)